LLARAGHTAILAARDAAALEELARAIAAEGGNAEVLPLDVTDPAAVARAVTQLTAAGGCDILVNNAALCRQTDFLLHPLDAQRAELEVNYWGPVRLTRAPARLHRARLRLGRERLIDSGQRGLSDHGQLLRQ